MTATTQTQNAHGSAWPGDQDALTPPADHGEESWLGRDRLRDKRVLITGGDSGIGRAVAVTFAKEGALLAITHLKEEVEDAKATRALVEAAGGTCLLIEADLRSEEENTRVGREAVEALGGLDCLICNAGFQMAYPSLEEFPPGQIQRTFSTNVFSPFWLTQSLAPQLPPGGSIIVTTSIQAYSPSPQLLDYAATKAALNNFVVNLAGELGPQGRPGKRRCPRADLDSPHPGDDGRRQGRILRR